MRSTFHELDLGKAVIQNATATSTEQLIVTLEPENPSSIRLQIKENKDGGSSGADSIAIDRHGLRMLVEWLREEGALS
ncbi:MAG: hypothetical protein ACO1N5_12890 [Noviherbaspirillum sp.]